MLNISIVLYKNNLQQIQNLLADNSPDNHLQQLAELHSQIKYIPAYHNPGYGAAHNLTINKSINGDVDYHLVVNPDIFMSRGHR